MKLSNVDFDDPGLIGSEYYDEIAALLQAQFPQYSSIAILDHVVRKRSPAFPTQVGAVMAAEQPLSLAHSDFSSEGARLRTEGYRSLGQVGKDQAYDMLMFGDSSVQALITTGRWIFVTAAASISRTTLSTTM
ncbi:hypothetical protein FB567DRAFT_124985 [Paraphoma chrysanthemicola]|uniref:Uncharacterized protein n=1 Tax=Paraphoma chrysanthemicola TaxID=798071 RepID=A0A8K0VV23_9PLEO|nr:hypothetical protein FB567DRAFT_124985 [Paraphoma chrysanthemicola]